MNLSILTRKDIDRFWNNVQISQDSNVCWPWKRSTMGKGYGQFAKKYLRKSFIFSAHRLAFILSGGILTIENPWVCHRCDNPPCCNPNHLFAGNGKSNMADMISKGRAPTSDMLRKRAIESVKRGNEHWVRLHPEKIARSDRGSFIHVA